MTEIVTTYLSLTDVTLAQSLILSFVVLAVMVPFRILGFPGCLASMSQKPTPVKARPHLTVRVTVARDEEMR